MDEIKSLLKTIAKGKQKQTGPKDDIIPTPEKHSKKAGKYTRSGSLKTNVGYGQAGPSNTNRVSDSSRSQKGQTTSKECLKRKRRETSLESSRERSVSPFSSSSSSSSSSPSPLPTSNYLHYEDIDRELRNSLRVSNIIC